jgi:hypothetical protein
MVEAPAALCVVHAGEDGRLLLPAPRLVPRMRQKGCMVGKKEVPALQGNKGQSKTMTAAAWGPLVSHNQPLMANLARF